MSKVKRVLLKIWLICQAELKVKCSRRSERKARGEEKLRSVASISDQRILFSWAARRHNLKSRITRLWDWELGARGALFFSAFGQPGHLRTHLSFLPLLVWATSVIQNRRIMMLSYESSRVCIARKRGELEHVVLVLVVGVIDSQGIEELTRDAPVYADISV